MTYETIICENRNGVLLITLNRPDRLNAWTYQMGRELHNAIEAGNDNEAVLAMVLTGSGRGFCAGADIVDLFKAQAESDADQGAGSPASGNWVELVRGSKPMVAAVNGAAIGVG
ncbi:MAG: enoyl-CoA hydratase-related protein, partial [Pseudomonadales bacterium]